MRAVVVMYDSLNRHLLSPYGCDWTHTPNFRRLAERCCTFETSYVGSMPCMPARRDFLTGRPHFLHRSWGPLEPFDDSLPKLLRQAGVTSHLISDHYHYWETGGATYHCQYDTWQFHRGQEGDPMIGRVAPPEMPERVIGRQDRGPWTVQDWTNRMFMRREEDQPQSKTFAEGIAFLERNHGQDNWFLQIETFDPHEPFFAHRKYRDLFPRDPDLPHFDWPAYRKVEESPELVRQCRHEYAALLAMCDAKLGDVLDTFDRLKLWDDTMLIVWTDHGFLLGEHDCWAKCWMPFWDEVARTPFFVWDPRCRAAGERRGALVQPALDLGPTLLRAFGAEPTDDMLGHDLAGTIAGDAPVREAAIFGMHGGHVNVTDGRYVYMRAPVNEGGGPLYNYTLMPTDMRDMWAPARFQQVELAPPFRFTKGCPLLKVPASGAWSRAWEWGTRLYDTANDPSQEHPLQDPALEARMTEHLTGLMRACDAPAEQFERLGLG